MRNKIKTVKEMKILVKELRSKGKEIAFTNGCFDLLHIGHVRYLYQANQLGDLLLVALNSDSSIRSLKGSTRPIMPEEDRLEMIAALEMVDYVTLFSELTCSSLLKQIKPDVYVKGGDYNPENLPEWPVVKKYGGRIEFVELIAGRATSDVIKKIKGVES